jgi:hypothetical protein
MYMPRGCVTKRKKNTQSKVSLHKIMKQKRRTVGRKYQQKCADQSHVMAENKQDVKWRYN